MDDASLSAASDASQPPEADLGRIVQQLVPILGEPDRDPEPLEGGITNRNYRVRLGGNDYVIRVPGKDTSLLGIDRAAEHAANQAAAKIGVAAPVAAFLTDPPAIVTEFIEGHGMEPEDLREPKALGNVADAIRAIHDAGPIPSRFDSFRVVEDYAATARTRGAEIPAAYGDALARAIEIEGALHGPEHDPVPCHNDLLAANFIWDGQRVRIVDWEYAGMGDRYFDLANFSINNELDGPQRTAFLSAYFGEAPSERQLAALRLFSFMSDFREAMWGVVQTVASQLDFDFTGYARKHFDRMAATAAAPEFADALEAVRGA
jgi:thiamine kinase-like enzyme